MLLYRELTKEDIERFASQLYEATCQPLGDHGSRFLLPEEKWQDVVRIFERLVAHATARPERIKRIDD